MRRIDSSATVCPIRDRRLEEFVADTHGFIRLCDGSASFALQSGESSYGIYVLWHYDALVMHLIDHVCLAVCYVEDVFPEGHFPHVSSHSSQVPHHLGDCVHAVNSVRGPDWCKPWGALQCFENVFLLRFSFQLDHCKVHVAEVEWSPSCHGCNVQFRNDCLCVGTLM